ncbi:hypothetical protein ASPNIDRAFT_36354 [Aspergillus niger ATCC 1015]|uniref:Halomucin n=1 Tax=Aspergillus niger (strain ATCC 1015 / CBS 113.46 / FGSC A1144 / LSHB Ac4 / NCTC 3858a / NRRL 328 / USDA 3528.7) TaxID=380704 RepID=G3XR23_ASPNA|nr:hypothetical protein ASPNIDRAFT_36354 [Aspergillus niger ATCC 1015]
MDKPTGVASSQMDKPRLGGKMKLPAGGATTAPVRNVPNKKKRALEEDSDSENIDDGKRTCIHLIDEAMNDLELGFEEDSEDDYDSDSKTESNSDGGSSNDEDRGDSSTQETTVSNGDSSNDEGSDFGGGDVTMDEILDSNSEESTSDEKMDTSDEDSSRDEESDWSVGSGSSDEEYIDVSDAESWGSEHVNDNNNISNNKDDDDEDGDRLIIQLIYPNHTHKICDDTSSEDEDGDALIQEDVDDTSSEDEVETEDENKSGCADGDSSTAFPACEFLDKHADKPGYIYDMTSHGKNILIIITTSSPPTLIRASARDLIMGSSVFAKVFGYNEEITDDHVWSDEDEERIWCPSGTNTRYDDINPVAMIWVLLAMRKLSMPDTLRVELALLKDIAVIVDRFQLQRAVKESSLYWLGGVYLREDGKNIPNRAELIDWVLYITWVFRAEKDFRQVTRGLIMDYYALPDQSKKSYTPQKICTAIYNARRQLIGELQAEIMDHLCELGSAREHVPHCVKLCSHDFRPELDTCFELTRSPKRYKKSPYGILLEVYKIVRRAEIVGMIHYKYPTCEMYPHQVLQGCEKRFRECLGIGFDREIVEKLSEGEVKSPSPLLFNFDAVNWPCKKWVGDGADEYPYQDALRTGQ